MIIDKIFSYENHFSLFNNSKKILKNIEKYAKKEKLTNDNFAYLTKSEIVVNPKDKSQYKVFDLSIFYYKNGTNTISDYSYDLDFVYDSSKDEIQFIKDTYNIFKFIQQQNLNGKFENIKLKYDEILNSEKAEKLIEQIIDYEKHRKLSYGNVEGIYYVMKYYNKKSNEIDIEKILSYENELQKEKLVENPSYTLLLGCLFLDSLKKFDFADFYNLDQTKREKISKIFEDKIGKEYNELIQYLKKVKDLNSVKNIPYYLFYLKKEIQENFNVSDNELVEFMRFYSKFYIYFNFKANQLLEKTAALLTEDNKYIKELKKHSNKNLKTYLFQVLNVINEELNKNNIIILKTKNDEKRFYKFLATENFYKKDVDKIIKHYSLEINYFEILANFYKQLKNKEIKRYFENQL